MFTRARIPCTSFHLFYTEQKHLGDYPCQAIMVIVNYVDNPAIQSLFEVPVTAGKPLPLACQKRKSLYSSSQRGAIASLATLPSSTTNSFLTSPLIKPLRSCPQTNGTFSSLAGHHYRQAPLPVALLGSTQEKNGCGRSYEGPIQTPPPWGTDEKVNIGFCLPHQLFRLKIGMRGV